MEKPAPEFADLLEPLQQLQAPSGCFKVFKVFKVDGGLALLTPKNCSKFVVKLKLPTSEEKNNIPSQVKTTSANQYTPSVFFLGGIPWGIGAIYRMSRLNCNCKSSTLFYGIFIKMSN